LEKIRSRAGVPHAGAGHRIQPGTGIRATISACTEREGDRMGKFRVLSEFWSFLRQEKKYWLVPIVVVFILFGLLIVFSQSSAVAPFIYTLF
jgi:uncharacterized protein DUF5989